ncbi:hypothetical protein O181_000924 [Austropuccinia psidii MF-1]|uniref:RNase H type-1 domain-containing protein n=1 Tax=Austropuccinia psidii MF-1 TaxID=1389203 RepID=A0A9Q3B9H2_9BASI|nr:hypothetical protein [Austropuccinia psidii MF-1]
MAYNNQGKWVMTNPTRSKAWWNKAHLNDLVKLRNKVRRNMLKNQTKEYKEEYHHYQQLFKQKVWELKRSHRRKFLAERGPEHSYQAYKFMKDKQGEIITSLRNKEGNLTSYITEKPSLMFYGTSIVENASDLNDTPHQQQPILPANFPQVTEDKTANTISGLPNRKAPGPDGIPNELIKLSKPLFIPIPTSLYNLCFTQGQYPVEWKETQTAIIRKAAKDDHANPTAYRPIELLNTLGKLFEKIINNCLMYWAHQTNSIHPGHMGGRPGKCINDMFLYGGVEELTKQHIKLTHNYIHTKLAAPIDNAHRTLIWRDLTKPHRSHPSPLNNLIGKDILLPQHFTRTETLSTFPIPPWSNQMATMTNSQLTKVQEKEEVTNHVKDKLANNNLVFFADGSPIPGKGGGSAAILTNTQTVKTTYVGGDSIITNFKTELMALLLCQELLTKHISTYGPPQAIEIFSDSQAALKSITPPKKKT